MSHSAYLATLGLKIHPFKSQLFATRYAVNFVGYRVLLDRVRVRNCNLTRSRKRLKHLQRAYGGGTASLSNLVQRLQSWEAHLKHADTHRLRRKIFTYWVFSKKN